MQTAAQLVPYVRELPDRLVFEVRSRSRPNRWHRVDMERRFGLGSCSCEAFNKGNDFDCRHLTLVRKYLAVRLAQAVIESHSK